MSTTILTTKLFLPPPPRAAVLRSRLFAQLDAGLHAKLTIVSAPPGSGKTTLVSAWSAHCGRQAAWLSLDAGTAIPCASLPTSLLPCGPSRRISARGSWKRSTRPKRRRLRRS